MGEELLDVAGGEAGVDEGVGEGKAPALLGGEDLVEDLDEAMVALGARVRVCGVRERASEEARRVHVGVTAGVRGGVSLLLVWDEELELS